jgi:hypothetical protein
MLTNDKVHRCSCKVQGLSHSFTADASGLHILMTDHERAHLLQNTTWYVAPIGRRNPSKLHARAASRAPRIKKGKLLHRLALGTREPKRKVRALNRNLLDCRRSNLQSVTQSDVRIFARADPVRKLVGVEYHVPPSWLKTDRHYAASIRVDGVKVGLGSWKTLEEAGCAFDAAARRVHGADATTNQSLGFVSAKVAGTKLCRRAAKLARRRVKEHKGKVAMEKLQAFQAATTQEERRAILQSMVSPSVRVASFAAPIVTPAACG